MAKMSEKEPLLNKISTSDLEIKEPTVRQRWISLCIAYVIMSTLFLQVTLYWPSMWPYISQIDPTTTTTFYGVVVMCNNLASAICAPLYGYWANRLTQTRIPLICGIIINMCGNALLMFAESFPSHHKWVVSVARLITGVGTGAFGCLFAYVAMGSTLKERNKAMAIRSAFNAVSIMAGPGLQAAFVPIGYPALVKGPFRLNMYTSPALFNIIIGLVEIIILIFLFKEYWVSATEDEGEESGNLAPYDKFAAVVVLIVQMVILFCNSYDNTIGSPFTMVMFKWTKRQAVLYNGIIQSLGGVIDFAGSLLIGIVALKYVKERTVITGGVCCLLMFYVVTFSYPSQPMLEPEFSLSQLESSEVNLTKTCNYDWCSYTTRINIVQYLFGYAFFIAALSVGFAPTATLYSKIIGPRKQGTLQGLFVSGGTTAMAIGPVICSTLFNIYGPRVAWAMGSAVVCACLMLIAITFKRLVPFEEIKPT